MSSAETKPTEADSYVASRPDHLGGGLDSTRMALPRSAWAMMAILRSSVRSVSMSLHGMKSTRQAKKRPRGWARPWGGALLTSAHLDPNMRIQWSGLPAGSSCYGFGRLGERLRHGHCPPYEATQPAPRRLRSCPPAGGGAIHHPAGLGPAGPDRRPPDLECGRAGLERRKRRRSEERRVGKE